MKKRLPCLVVVAAALLAAVQPAQAALIRFAAHLDGPSEAPPNASPGTGYTNVDFDTTAHTMRVRASFENLVGTVTAAHIHCCTALPETGTAGVVTPVPSFPLFPTGVSNGFYDMTFDMTQLSSYNPAFVNNAINGGSVATAEQTLLAGLLGGRAYLNIHSNVFPGGEIRGFLQVPEPASLALAGLGIGLAALSRRRSRIAA